MKYGGSRGVKISGIPFPIRDGICKICGKSVHKFQIKFTNLHHMIYEYRPITVKKAADKGDYSLALKNTIEVDAYCHKFMDSVRTILSVDINRLLKGTTFLPKIHKDKLAKFCKLYLEQYDNENEGKV